MRRYAHNGFSIDRKLKIDTAVSTSKNPKNGAGAVATLVVALQVDWKPSSKPASVLGTEDRATSASLAEAVQTMPAQIWESVQPKAQAALQNDPLQKEATALYADARSALGFLAYNFLPEGS